MGPTCSSDCPLRQAWLPVVAICGAMLLLGASVYVFGPPSRHSLGVAERDRQAAEARAHEAVVARFGVDATPVPAVPFARGKAHYEQSCAACHGADGTGVAAIGGKDLVASPFVTAQDDAGLAAFIAAGREIDDPANTTGLPMPARGGNEALADESVADIVTYLRGLQDPRRRPAGPLPRVAIADDPAEEAVADAATGTATAGAADGAAGSPAAVATVAAADGGEAAALAMAALDPEAVKRGKRAYLSCLACHGRDGTGVKGIGKDLIHSPFSRDTPDEELVAFIKVGRGPSDPASTTGLAMPPKGGNPALKDDQIRDIVVYLRSLQQASAAKADAGS